MTRRSAVRRVGLVILGANVLLFFGKGLVYLETGSLAVGSEAVNSLADTVYSIVVVAGLYLTTQPPDFEHPHGHERIEPLVSLFIAIGIFSAGVGVLWSAGQSLMTASVGPRVGPTAIGILVASAGIKYILFLYAMRIGRERTSPALIATAADNRNDVLTAGAALAGVLGVMAGFPSLDAIAAIVVSAGIFYTGWEVVQDNLNYLVGRAPPEELRSEIIERALGHPDVEGAHDVIAHYVGPEVDVSLHIEVEGNRTLTEAHDIESEVVQTIRQLDSVDDVFVHVDPKELGEWKQDESVDELVRRSQMHRERRKEP